MAMRPGFQTLNPTLRPATVPSFPGQAAIFQNPVASAAAALSAQVPQMQTNPMAAAAAAAQLGARPPGLRTTLNTPPIGGAPNPIAALQQFNQLARLPVPAPPTATTNPLNAQALM